MPTLSMLNSPSFIRSRLPQLILIAITLVTFLPCTFNHFTTWDDNDTIARNPDLNPTITLTSFSHFWTHPQADLYIPVTYSTWALIAPLARRPDLTLSAAPYHALNLFLHLLNTLLVYRLLHKLTGKSWSSFFAAALFALHPVQAEPIAWTSGTKDLLSATFALLALLNYFRSTPSSILYPLSSSFLFLLSLLSKPSTLPLPFVALTISTLLLHRPFRATLISLLPWFIISIPILLIGRLSQPAHALSYIPPLAFPLHLCIDYGRSPLHILSSPTTLYTISTTLLFFACIFFLRQFRPALAAAIIFLLFLLPTLGFLPFDFQQYSTTADHYLYLSLLAPALLLAYIFPSYTILYPLSSILLLFSLRSFTQSQTWHDSPTLFSHTLAINPRSIAAHTNLAIALANANDLTQSAAEFRASLRLNFADPKPHLGLGQVLARLHQPDLAQAHLRLSIHLDPSNPLTYYNLALLLSSLNQPDQARAEYERTLKLDPTFAEAHTNLATLLLSQGQLDAAEQHYRTALSLRPDLTLPRRGLQAIEQARHSQ
jgi:tetratricopeptide (TPR) repeat protein